MEPFQAIILKRRRLRALALTSGLLALGLLCFYALTYMQYGEVPVLEELIRLLDLQAYRTTFLVGTLFVLLLLIAPMLQTIFKKKRLRVGQIEILEDKIIIHEGTEIYESALVDISQLDFDIPPIKKTAPDAGYGGNILKIPTSEGLFKCEFLLENKQHRQHLIATIQMLKEKYGMEIKGKL